VTSTTSVSLQDADMNGPGGRHGPNTGAGGHLQAAVTKHTDTHVPIQTWQNVEYKTS